VIAGFPGETEAQWQETLALVEVIGFGDVHVFPFSPRPGTKAADLSGQVRPEVARARAQQLRQLAERLRRAALLRMIGRQTEVLVEGREDPTVPAAERLGYTPGYLPVRIVGLSDRIGRGERIRWVRLTGVTPGGEALVGVEDSHPAAGPGMDTRNH
jgi:threonylcarbamoyladenosine tRNA methylthiotransferase MtaB